MSSTITDTKAWSKSHPSPWRRLRTRPAKFKEKDAGDWPGLKRDKKSLQVEGEKENIWGKVEPLPTVDVPQHKSAGALDKAVRIGKAILQRLAAMREAQDAPDFKRSPTDEAYKAAHKSLKAAYTHYVGSAPAPAIAPDGDGGVVVQWKTGKREVRLVVPPDEIEKSYIFSRGDKEAKVDYDISGLVLARQLRSTFAD